MYFSHQIYDIYKDISSRCHTNIPEIIADELCLLMYEDLGSLSGFYNRVLDKDVIFVNKKLDENTSRLIIAHELGHFALHRTICNTRPFNETNLFESTDRLEYEANAFASHLLIDNDELLEYARDGYTSGMLASAFGVPEELVLIKISEMISLGVKLRLPHEPNAKFLKTFVN